MDLNEEAKKRIWLGLAVVLSLPILCLILFITIMVLAGSGLLAAFLILAAILPFIFTNVLALLANQWSFGKQLLHGIAFSLIILGIDAASLVVVYRNINAHGKNYVSLILCVVFIIINDYIFTDYMLHFKQKSKENSCSNRISFVVGCDSARHDRLMQGILTEDEEEYIGSIGHIEDGTILARLLEGDGFAEFISKKYEYDYGAALHAIIDNSTVRDVLESKKKKAQEDQESQESEEP